MGGEVSMFYDPMIAKLITWGADAPRSDRQADRGARRFEIEGLGHNIDFVSAIMQHPRFRSGELTTGFIAEEYPEGFHGAPASEELLRRLAAIAAFAAWRRRIAPAGSTDSWASACVRRPTGWCRSTRSIIMCRSMAMM
jgi:propionyl-CoA carboxylase alpha chain